MELSYRMLTAPSVFSNENPCIATRNSTPDTNIPRRIDLYFVSNKRPKGKYSSGWVSISPEELLAEKFKGLPEVGESILSMEYPYYLCGICYKIYDSPADTMSRRQCIELLIDGENTVLEVGEKSLFIVDRHKKIRYELIDNFKSRITTCRR